MTRKRSEENYGTRGSSRRSAKEKAGKEKVVKEKFQEQRGLKVVHIQPMNPNQEKYLELLKSKTLVVAKGSSGTGKSYLACLHSANRLLRGEVDKIVLVRPYESVGRSIGLRPGTGEEKLLPLMQSMIQPLIEVFGTTHFEYLVEHGQIVLEALEDCRGRSYKRAVIIVDESQNADIKTIQTLVTRIGEGSQMILAGDGVSWQRDIKGEAGITWLTKVIQSLRKEKPEYLDHDDMHHLNNSIGIVSFTKDDVVRSGITKMFVKVFDEESNEQQKAIRGSFEST